MLFFSLSNELLRKVVKNLHAPAAVCLALTCKHLMTVVTSVCDCNLDSIVRRYKSDVLCYDWDNALQDYTPTAADIVLSSEVNSAYNYLFGLAYETIYGLKVGYTLEYIGLMNQFDDPKMYPHARKGHAKCLRLGQSECAMCAVLEATAGSVSPSMGLERMVDASI